MARVLLAVQRCLIWLSIVFLVLSGSVIGSTGDRLVIAVDKALLGVHDAIMRGISSDLLPRVDTIVVSNLRQILVEEGGREIDMLLAGGAMARSLQATVPGAFLSVHTLFERQPELQELLMRVVPVAREECIEEGVLRRVPVAMTLAMIGYNVKQVTEAGLALPDEWTWSDYAVVSEKLGSLAVPNRVYPSVIAGSPTAWMPFLLANNGGYLSVAGDRSLIGLPGSRQALEFLQWLVTSKTAAYVRGFGELLLSNDEAYLAPCYSTVLVVSPRPGTSRQTLGLKPYPTSPQGKTSSLASVAVYLVSARSRNLAAVSAFLLHALERATQEQITHASGWFPIRFGAYAAPVGFPSPAAFQEVALAAEPYPPPEVGGRWIYQPVSDYFPALMQGDMSVAEFVDRVERDLAAIIAGQ